MKKNTAIEIISSLFILLFVYTAISKLRDLHLFQAVLLESPLVKGAALYLAWALPFLELAISALLFIPKTRRKGLFSSLVLLTIFTMYIGYMILFTPKLPCNCGGAIQNLTWKQHLLFNTAFIMLAAVGVRLMNTSIKQIKEGNHVYYT